MKEFVTKVGSPVGLHARPAALFAQSSKNSGCKVSLEKIKDDGASILKIMSLGIKCGESVRVQIEGDNETDTASALQEIVESSDH